MAIYHLEAKVISRGTGRSAVAAAAYMSCSRILNDYDGVQHDYTNKHGLIWERVFLPAMAPQEWADRAVLWNAVEEAEKTKDSRLARELVAALPVELEQAEWIGLLTEFVQCLVSDGMCADVCIHDTDGHNPHAHIMLTVRPLKEDGTWQQKTEKEYLCVRDGEEQGFTAAEFKLAQAEGWEKQYLYKIERKKVYMAPSAAEAQGYERASKYPKSTKYGRQNPITERWNSEEQLLTWRETWADVNNRYLERAGQEERIDHRSHAERGIDEQPTVHEGVTARIMEQQGGIADRCELNRQIKADNALLRELKAAVKKLVQAVKNTLPMIADLMESLRAKMIVCRYQELHIMGRERPLRDRLSFLRPNEQRVTALETEIKGKTSERKSLVAEREQTPVIFIPKKRELTRRIAEITEELEELRSERAALLETLGCPDGGLAPVRKGISELEKALDALKQQEMRCYRELEAVRSEFGKARTKAKAEFDPIMLHETRKGIRPEKEQDAQRRVQEAYGGKYSPQIMADSKRSISELLDEEMEDYSVRAALRQREREARQSQHRREKRRDDWER